MAEPGDARDFLFTGFPGFIGVRLLPRLLELHPGTRAVCLVQPRFQAAAHDAIAGLEHSHPHTRGRLQTVAGDITEPGLGLAAAESRRLQGTLVAAYHLAAVYDLAVSRELGVRVNVEGTRNVLAFLSEARRLERLHYVSTAYVSGTHRGLFRETDLEVGQSFKNFYEETKYLAEVEVVRSALPATVYRPAIVVGDSRTGETAKFDGPYFTLTAMERTPSPGVFLKIGAGGNPANLVPVDFVVEALARLSATAGSRGLTYHLTDPQPPSVLEVARLFARELGKSFVYVPVPLALAKAALSPSLVQRALGMPVQTLDYFDNPCRYDTSQAGRDLAAVGVVCPRLEDYVSRLVAFYREHRGKVRRAAMV
jgi:thioester reductase-like protein